MSVESYRLHLRASVIRDTLNCIEQELDQLLSQNAPSTSVEGEAKVLCTRARGALGDWDPTLFDREANATWEELHSQATRLQTLAVSHSLDHIVSLHREALSAFEARWALVHAGGAAVERQFTRHLGMDLDELRRLHDRRRRATRAVALCPDPRQSPVPRAQGSARREPASFPRLSSGEGDVGQLSADVAQAQSVFETTLDHLPSITLCGPSLRIKRGRHLVAAGLEVVPDFELSFHVRVARGHAGERIPLLRFERPCDRAAAQPGGSLLTIWLHPGSLTLDVDIVTDTDRCTSIAGDTASTLSPGRWHHFRLLVAGRRVKALVDGENPRRILVGPRQTTSAMDVFIGDIDEVSADVEVDRIIYRPLTPSPAAAEWLRAMEQGLQLLDALGSASHLNPEEGPYLVGIDRCGERQVQLRWLQPRAVLPEYQAAKDEICLEHGWMGSTPLLRHLGLAETMYGKELQALKGAQVFRTVVQRAVANAFCCGQESADSQVDPTCGQLVCETLVGFHGGLEPWKQPHFAFAINLVAQEVEDDRPIVALLAQIVNRSSQGKTAGLFGLVVLHAYRRLFKTSPHLPEGRCAREEAGAQIEDALCCFYEMMEIYIVSYSSGEQGLNFVSCWWAAHCHLQSGSPYNNPPLNAGTDSRSHRVSCPRMITRTKHSRAHLWNRAAATTPRAETRPGKFAVSFRRLCNCSSSCRPTSCCELHSPFPGILTMRHPPLVASSFPGILIMRHPPLAASPSRTLSPRRMADHVETHAVNWFASLLLSTLGIALPLLPDSFDTLGSALVDFWEGMKDDAWPPFASADAFGRPWEELAALERPSDVLSRSDVASGQFPEGNANVSTPTRFANEAVNPRNNSLRRKYAVYLTRFCYFFKREVFLQRAFEALNGEVKPSYVGFQTAFQTIL